MTGGKLGVWLLGICCLAANGAEPEMNRIPAGDYHFRCLLRVTEA